MYSMVLMAALTTGTDMPDWGRRGWGCCGCYGGYGWGGYGGYGGYGWGGWGGGYGGYGGWGGWGGWGGGYGGWGYAMAPALPTYGGPVIVSNTLPAAPTTTRSLYLDPAASNGRMSRGTIIVHLPADARLIVDGKQTQSTSANRRFVTPPLDQDRGYHYIFKAERERDGQTVTMTKRIDIRAGETRQVYLNFADRDMPAERGNSLDLPAENQNLPRPQKTGPPNPVRR